jgi:hypothetical protein
MLIIMTFSLFSACDKDPVDDNTPPAVDPTVVTGVGVNPKAEAILVEGGHVQLNAIVLPVTATNKNVTWTSSNPAVATVDATGCVTAVGNGVATITVATEEGNFVARSTITVSFPVSYPILASQVKIEGAEDALYVGDKVALKATVFPPQTTDTTVDWSSSDETVATVDEWGTVTALKKGEVTITATAVGGACGSVTITVKKQSSSGDGNGNSGTGGGTSSTGKDGLSFGQKPKYPAASLDANGFLTLADPDILQKYHDYNKDVVAWIYVPGTNINLPVAQRASDTKNEYYLSRGLDGKSKVSGSCFLDFRNTFVSSKGQLLDHNNIFYGHAKEDDIFDQLENVTRTDAWFNKESNRYVYVNTLTHRYVFKIFATYYLDTSAIVNGKKNSVIQDVNFRMTSDQIIALSAGDPAGFIAESSKINGFKDTASFLQFCTSWKSRVMTNYSEDGVNYAYLKNRDFGVTVDPDDVIITLYTCADHKDVNKYIVQATLEKVEVINK